MAKYYNARVRHRDFKVGVPPGNARRTEVAPSMEHQASPEILPVDDSRKSDTLHLQFISFI